MGSSGVKWATSPHDKWMPIPNPNASTPESSGIPSTRRIGSQSHRAGGAIVLRNSSFCPRRPTNFCWSCRRSEFAKMSSAAETNDKISARDRRVFLRQLHSRAQHAAADRQGRLVLPDDLCQRVGLKNEVALVGNRGRFEIWNLQRWKRAHEDETPTYQHVAKEIGL